MFWKVISAINSFDESLIALLVNRTIHSEHSDRFKLIAFAILII